MMDEYPSKPLSFPNIDILNKWIHFTYTFFISTDWMMNDWIQIEPSYNKLCLISVLKTS